MVANELKCWIYEQDIKEQYSEVYGLGCEGLDTQVAKGYNWVLSKVPPCTLTYEEQCRIDKFIANITKDYICTPKEDCTLTVDCTLEVTIVEPTSPSCRLSVRIL